MRTLAVLFLCLGTLFIQAQSLFVNSYGNPGSQEEARAITRSHDGNYVRDLLRWQRSSETVTNFAGN